MTPPRDPGEVEPTLVPGARPTDTDAEKLAREVEGTLIAGANALQRDTNNDAEATRMGAATAATPQHVAPQPGTVVEPNAQDPGATIQAPVGKTIASESAAGASNAGSATEPTHAIPPRSHAHLPGETGSMVGRFALRDLHASGGLGEVFTARDTELNREVAVKRIKSRYADDPASRRRFLTEAELTARLDHPGVVPVFGLVNDARGRPVYAMRFIRGETLKDEIERYHGIQKPENKEKTEKTAPTETKPGESKETDTATTAAHEKEPPRTVAFRQLLSRFISVCQAIAYAHEKGIIHRDIKPANVMVGKFGEVLVVDWGLAKSLKDGPDYDKLLRTVREAGAQPDPEATDLPSNITQAGTAVGTPSYMAPEQASGEIEKVGPKADVYALGATLFAILTGKAPFSGKTAQDTLEMVRRGAFSPPATINTACPKPLDAICRKAMALNIADRYETALELAHDVERWLSDEPVTAYRDPLLARLARWTRRHPARVATAVSVLLAGVLAVAGVAWAINEGRKSTQAALDRVTEEEKKTAAALTKVTEQEKETAQALVQVTKEKANTEAEKVRVETARNLARARYEKAVASYNTLVHDIDRKLADRVATQDLRKTLLLNAADGLRKLVDGRVEGNLGADRTLVAAYRQMGDVYQRVGDTTESRKHFLEAVNVARAVQRDASPNDARAADRDLGLSLQQLAEIHVRAGDTKAAIDAINEAITLFEKLAQDKTDTQAQQDLAAARVTRSTILMERGETGKAVDDCKLAVATCEQLSDALPNNLERKRELAASLDTLTTLQLRTGRTSDALETARKCLTARLALSAKLSEVPDVQRELADAHTRLGNVYFDRARMSDAAKEYRAGLAILEKLATEDPQSATTKAELARNYGRLGTVQLRTGDIADALTNTTKCKTLCAELHKTDPTSAKAQRELAESAEQLGDALLASGSADAALKEFQQSIDLLTPLQTADKESARAKLDVARGLERIGDGKLATKDAKAAIVAFHDSVKIREAATKQDQGSATTKRDLAVGLYKLADAHNAAGNTATASEFATRATELLVTLASTDPGSGQAQRDIALAYGKWGQLLAGDGHPTGALLVWQNSLNRFQKLAGVDKNNIQAKEEEAIAWERLAGFYATVGNHEQALYASRQAVNLWNEIGQQADAKTKIGQRRLALAMIRCGDISTEVRELTAANDWYTRAAKEIPANTTDPILAPVAELAGQKLKYLDAVKAGLKNPQALAEPQFAAVRAPALRTVGLLELRADRPTEATQVAEELAKLADTTKQIEDHYNAARIFAGCAASSRGNDFAKDASAKDAVKCLKAAIALGYRDADTLSSSEWDAVRKRNPEFVKLEAELAKTRTAPKQ